MLDVRAVTRDHARAWLELRHALWPDADRDEHAHEIEQFFAGRLSMPPHVLLARRRGVGTALVEAAERWVVARGCTELASDAAEDNRVSQQAHLASGFQEVVRIRCFRKDLVPPPPAGE